MTSVLGLIPRLFTTATVPLILDSVPLCFPCKFLPVVQAPEGAIAGKGSEQLMMAILCQRRAIKPPFR